MSKEEPEVTFVGGRAVEQSEGLDSNLEEDEREAAKAAVKKAIDEAGKQAAKEAKEDKAKDPFKPPGAKSDKDEKKDPKESKPKSKDDSGEDSGPSRGPDGKFVSKSGNSEGSEDDSKDKPSDGIGSGKRKTESGDEKEFDPETASVKEFLKNREKIANLKKNAKEEISAERQQFESERQAFYQQQLKLQQQQELLQRQAQALQALKSDPARAVREAGYDPEQFILDLAQEGTPEGKAQRELRELRDQLVQMQNYQQHQLRQQQMAQQQYQHQQIANARNHAVQTFVKLGMDEDKYPHIATFYKGRERSLVAAGDLTAEEYRTLSGGKEGGWEDILDYIEDQLAERANSWYEKRGAGKVKTAHVDDERPKSKGKTLSPDVSGERRTLKPKTLNDLDGEERLEAARQAVAVALANSK